MPTPSLLLALLIAILYGALFHLFRGGKFMRLLFYFLLSIIGFVAGHLVGIWQGWVLFPLGVLNLGLSTSGSVLFLFVGDWLNRLAIKQPESTV